MHGGYITNLHNTHEVIVQKITIFPKKSIYFKENDHKKHLIIVKGSALIQVKNGNKFYYYENQYTDIPKKVDYIIYNNEDDVLELIVTHTCYNNDMLLENDISTIEKNIVECSI